jgi:hypothetical protein
MCCDLPCDAEVHCEGVFEVKEACNCAAGVREEIQEYKISKAAANGGEECPYKAGEVQKGADCGCPPVNCDGKWDVSQQCDCPNGIKVEKEKFSITIQASEGGAACPAKEGEERQSKDCQCPPPVDCKGEWKWVKMCACEFDVNGDSTGLRRYTHDPPASNGGRECRISNGEEKEMDCHCTTTEAPTTVAEVPTKELVKSTDVEVTDAPAEKGAEMKGSTVQWSLWTTAALLSLLAL